MTVTRLPTGGLIDRLQPLRFTWNGRALSGYVGDTLASALLANDVRILGRSFKYHRPRGLFAAGVEEPNAILDVTDGARHEPNARATMVQLRAGMEARAFAGFPSVARDLYRGLDLLHRFLPAGFYYKTFMAPDWHRWEGPIRRMAGLGRARPDPDTRHYETRHARVDILVIGAGPAGLAAARAATAAGLDTLVVDENPRPGGSLLWQDATIDGLPARAWAATGKLRMLTATTAFGYYDHNTLGLLQLRDAADGWAEDVFWRVQARQVILATGAHERPLVFPNNDRPGVMLASAVRRYICEYAVLPGSHAVVITNNDSAYATAIALRDAGAKVTVADIRATTPNIPGIAIHPATAVLDTGGFGGLRWADLGPADATSARQAQRRIECDLIATAGGWTPAIHLFSQSGGKTAWSEAASAFLPADSPQNLHCAGNLTGAWSLADCLASGHAAASAAAAGLGHTLRSPPPITSPTPAPIPLQPYWHVPIPGARQWIDLQNDVTVKDVRLAAAENFRSVEHLKRYTTLGMATDQGKTSNINGLAAMAAQTGRSIAQTGTTTFRPPYTPVTLGALAGTRHGALYAPCRELPAQSEHLAAGAEMREYGGWRRPACYMRPGETAAAAIQREAAGVREDAGLFDGSSLGKIEVQGPDAAEFLNLIYYNEVANLKPGRLRYVVLLRESGIVYDDGVIARLAPDRYLLSPSSSHTAGVLAMLELWHQTEYPHLDVAFHDVTAAWATFALCGPRAPAILATLQTDIDLAALPHMAISEGHLLGVPARIARVSFTGERSWEISVPAAYAAALWRRLIAHAPVPYGIESLSVLRAEKGYILIGTDTDGLTLPADLGITAPLRNKRVDFVGRRSLTTEDALRPDRRQFVGLLPEDPKFVPAVGSHAITADRRSQGWITTAAHSPACGRSIALAMIEAGRSRIGETITLFDRGTTSRATICSPVFHDPEGKKLDA